MELIDKLVIVAHADDELLWGGANLLAARGWHVIVSQGAKGERRRALAQTMSWLGVSSWEMYDVPENDESEDVDEALARYRGTGFHQRVKELAAGKSEWNLVLTHNEEGEYGHGDNMAVHVLVKEAFAGAAGKLRFFGFDEDAPLEPDILAEKAESARFYAPTRNLCKRLFTRDWKSLKARPIFLKYLKCEKVYALEAVAGASANAGIPAIFHQIWFGGVPAQYKKYLFEKNENIAKKAGVHYKLWGNADFNEDAFPLTWAAIQRALEVGEETGQSRWAQVADLARIEFVHRFGGAYFDSLIEVSDRMWPAIREAVAAAGEGGVFIGCNEDPCGLDCKGAGGKPYLTNSFFAATWRHPVLRRALKDILDDKVDLSSKFINRTTGPYFLRKCIRGDGKKDGVHLLPTQAVFPFLVNGSEYRKAEPNGCLVKGSGSKPPESEPDAIPVGKDTWYIRDCLARKYPESLAVYNSGLGGSWSW